MGSMACTIVLVVDIARRHPRRRPALSARRWRERANLKFPSFIPLQLALSPMRGLARGVEFPDLVPVDRLHHHADPREHHRAAERRMTCVSTMLERTVA